MSEPEPRFVELTVRFTLLEQVLNEYPRNGYDVFCVTWCGMGNYTVILKREEDDGE
jgi:hypothetical protein